MIPSFRIVKTVEMQPNCSENIVFFDAKIIVRTLSKLVTLENISKIFLRITYNIDNILEEKERFIFFGLFRITEKKKLSLSEKLKKISEYTLYFVRNFIHPKAKVKIYFLYPEVYIETPLEIFPNFLRKFFSDWKEKEYINEISAFFLDKENIPLFYVKLYGFSVIAGEKYIKNLYIEENEGFSSIAYRTFFMFRRSVMYSGGMQIESTEDLLSKTFLGKNNILEIPFEKVGIIDKEKEELGDFVTVVGDTQKALKFLLFHQNHFFVIRRDKLEEKILEKLLVNGYFKLFEDNEDTLLYNKENGNMVLITKRNLTFRDPKESFLDMLSNLVGCLSNLEEKQNKIEFIEVKEGISKEFLEIFRDKKADRVVLAMFQESDLFGMQILKKDKMVYIFYLDILKDIIGEFYERKGKKDTINRDN